MVLCAFVLSWDCAEKRLPSPCLPPPLFGLAQKLSDFMMVFSRPDLQTYWSKHLGSTAEEFLIILSHTALSSF